MLPKLLARDLGIAALAALVFLGAESLHAWAPGPLTAVLTLLLTVAAGYVVGYLVHEWGHFAGARMAGSAIALNDWRSLFLFRFDMERNSPVQFLSLGWGGNLSPWVYAAVLAAALGSGTLARAGLLIAAFAGALFVNLVELPILSRVARGEEWSFQTTGAYYARQGGIALLVAAGGVWLLAA